MPTSDAVGSARGFGRSRAEAHPDLRGGRLDRAVRRDRAAADDVAAGREAPLEPQPPRRRAGRLEVPRPGARSALQPPVRRERLAARALAGHGDLDALGVGRRAPDGLDAPRAPRALGRSDRRPGVEHRIGAWTGAGAGTRAGPATTA